MTGRAVQRHRMALLAILASSPRALPRDKLIAWLWPESDAEHGRRLLNQAVHVLRRALGADAILSVGEDLQLNPALVSCDVVAFEAALSAGDDLRRAAGLYAGPFLDGFFLGDAPEFEQWVGRERDRLAAAYARALEGLAERAELEGDRTGAVEWWKARAALDPYDSSVALRVMQALDASGNHAAALLEAAAHQRLLRDELDLAPPPEVLELAERLRSSPAAASSRDARALVQPPLPQAAGVGARAVAAGVEPRAHPPPRTYRGLRYAAAALVMSGIVLGALRLRSRPAASPPAAGSVAPGTVDEIARAVARELDRRQRGDTAVRQAPRRTSSIAAYELYLRGSDPRVLRSDSAARLGLEYFRRAVALDSTYAAAWAGLARMTLRTSQESDPTSRRRALSTAEAAARRAIALDDSLGEAHATLGLVRVNQNDLAGGEAELRRAIVLEPGTARNYEYLVRLYVWLGRPADALAVARRALELDPLSPSATAELARAFLANGQCDEALAQLQKIAGLDPPLQRAATIAAQCYARKERWQEAIAAVRAQAERGGRQAIGLFGYLLARAGQRDEAKTVLDTLIEEGRRRGGQALNVALVYAGLSNVDEAMAWLQRAVEDLTQIAFSEAAPTVTGMLDSRPGDARVVALRRRLGLQNR